MGAVRVTQRMLADRVLNNISVANLSILKLQEQLATGRSVNRPSDNPLAARRAVAARSQISENEQYLTNISTASPYLQETETTILMVENVLQRARELALQGSSGTNGQLQRDQIAEEVDQLIESALVEANHITAGRYIFGGTNTLNAPFVATRDVNGEVTAVTYEGNDEHFDVEISEGVYVTINETGTDVFTQTTPETVDVFQTLIDLRENLRAADYDGLTTGLEDLNSGLDQLLFTTARLGAVQNRMTRADDSIRDLNVEAAEYLSDNVDADLAEVIVNLNAQTNAFQAALNAGGRVIQPSLLDFL